MLPYFNLKILDVYHFLLVDTQTLTLYHLDSEIHNFYIFTGNVVVVVVGRGGGWGSGGMGVEKV